MRNRRFVLNFELFQAYTYELIEPLEFVCYRNLNIETFKCSFQLNNESIDTVNVKQFEVFCIEEFLIISFVQISNSYRQQQLYTFFELKFNFLNMSDMGTSSFFLYIIHMIDISFALLMTIIVNVK